MKLFVINIAVITLKPAEMIEASINLKKFDCDFEVIKTSLNRQKSINIFCSKKVSIYIVMQ